MAPAVALLLSACGNPPDNCILGEWRGTYVTEAVNVQLDVRITGLGVADAGDWSFTGADDIDLGSGDVQAWQTGAAVTMFIFSGSPGPSNALVGTVNEACDHMEGDISGGNIGRFVLDRI